MKTLYWVIGIAALGLIVWGVWMSRGKGDNFETATSTVSEENRASSCSLGDCPFEIYESDSGKTFSYTETSRFTVWLDKTRNPEANLSCAPSGIIGSISNIPSTTTPNIYPARFEAVHEGTCILKDTAFKATINIYKVPSAS